CDPISPHPHQNLLGRLYHETTQPRWLYPCGFRRSANPITRREMVPDTRRPSQELSLCFSASPKIERIISDNCRRSIQNDSLDVRSATCHITDPRLDTPLGII